MLKFNSYLIIKWQAARFIWQLLVVKLWSILKHPVCVFHAARDSHFTPHYRGILSGSEGPSLELDLVARLNFIAHVRMKPFKAARVKESAKQILGVICCNEAYCISAGRSVCGSFGGVPSVGVLVECRVSGPPDVG